MLNLAKTEPKNCTEILATYVLVDDGRRDFVVTVDCVSKLEPVRRKFCQIVHFLESTSAEKEA